MRAVLWKPPLHLATAGFCERCSSKDVVALVCVYDLSVPPASGPGLWATMDGLSPWKWSRLICAARDSYFLTGDSTGLHRLVPAFALFTLHSVLTQSV